MGSVFLKFDEAKHVSCTYHKNMVNLKMYCFPLCKTKLCKILFYRFSEFLFLNASWRIYAMDVSCLARLCMTECSLEIS